MNYRELAEIHQEQIKGLMKTIESLRYSLNSQNKTITSLTNEIAELKKILLEKDKKTEALALKLNGVVKIALPKKIEKRRYVDTTLKGVCSAPSPKERGNNGAKRKEYNNN